MTTLVPTSSQQQPGTTSATSSGVESYEDMFKEITRKLYGDESAHGLYPINNSQVAQLAQTPSAPPEGERSFTTLVSDRNLAQLEYESVIQTDASSNFKSEDHLSTAFGLAALMHNGFPPPTVFPVTTNAASKQTQAAQVNGEDRQWSQQQTSQQNQSQQEEPLWNSNKATNAYTQKLFKIKTKQEPITVSEAIVINTSSGTANVKSEGPVVQKRYSCSVCPYSTDRRDLFTRHENIHKEEKPFHCYACLKQFNRADHVKKHFLRMHREMDYDINKTRRYPPSSKQIVNSNNNNNNNNNSSNSNNNKSSNNFFYNQTQQQQQQQQQSQQQTTETQPSATTTTINIPTFSQTTNSAQHHSIEQVIQQNNTNNQQNTVNSQSVSINIKHEKQPVQGKIQKPKGEKRFMCCYCPWSGADNWGLKRHLNTHTKPFVCLLCDYKAARSERLTTHILKVHNKKACNKCSFFADDQAQLTQHQIDSHQNETRTPRVNNPTTNNHPVTAQSVVTNQSINQPVSSTNINSTNNITSTGNVLRTLTNTFVPNIHTTSTSNNVFGTLNSSLSNGVSTIYTTSNVNTNIVDQINHHLTTNNWRTSNNINVSSNQNNNNTNNNNSIVRNQQSTTNTLTFTNTSSGTQATKRKSGAERLFAYFEADDSDDLELDYARQLQMQALSRNTASVAQDFHNAGGENLVKSIILQQNKMKGVNSVSCNIIKNNNNNNNNYSSRDINGTIGQQQEQKKRIKAMSPIDHSPPATLELITNSIKRRRKSSSSNDKENVNELLTTQLKFLKEQHQLFLQNLNASIMSDGERLKAISEINEIFEGMYRNSLNIITSIQDEKFIKPPPPQPQPQQQQQQSLLKIKREIIEDNNNENEGESDFTLPAFLRNNKEITVIMDPKNHRSKVKTDECLNSETRKNRKQLKPKKIEKDIVGEEADSNGHQSSNVESECKNSITNNINNLRDKHMLKLVTKKKCCYLCRNKSIDANSYYSKESLLLHNIWRHKPKKLECHRCEMRFNKIYKLKLHKTLERH